MWKKIEMAKIRPDLGDLLEKLYTEEGRNKLVSRIVGEKEIPKNNVIRTIENYEENEKYKEAVDVALKAGMIDRAIKVYEKKGFLRV